jgi:hypothetical protein
VWPATTILEKVESGYISLNREDQAIKINEAMRPNKAEQGQCEC